MSPQNNGTDALSPRAAVISAQIAMTVQASIGFTLVTCVFILVILALEEKWPTIRIRRRQDRTIFYVFGLVFFTFLFFIVELLMYARNWSDNPDGCYHLGRGPLIPFIFLVAKQFMYFLLFERACIVLDTLNLHNWFFNLLRYGVMFAIVFGISGGFYWTCFVYFYGQVMAPEGGCVMFTLNGAFIKILSLAGCDVALSLVMLFLFAYPLYRHLHSLKTNVAESNDHVLFKLLRRNMILSSLITFSTSSNLIIMVVLLLSHNGSLTRDQEYWQIYAMFFPAWDMMISLMLILRMTNAWVPSRFTVALRFVSYEEEKQKNPAHTSKNTSKPIGAIPGDNNLPNREAHVLTNASISAAVSPIESTS